MDCWTEDFQKNPRYARKYLPKLNELVVFHMAVVFLLIQVFGKPYAIDFYKLVFDKRPSISGSVYEIFSVFLGLAMLAGLIAVFRNVFRRTRISKLEHKLMVVFALVTLAITGILAGFHILGNLEDQPIYMLPIPFYNIFCGLAVFYLGDWYFTPDYFDTGYQAHPVRLILETGAICLIVYVCFTRTNLHWTLVQSICITIASRLDTDVGALLNVLRPGRNDLSDG